MFRNMVTSLLKHERIRTTDVKAKELRRWADHLITLAKRGDLHARRQAMAIVYEKDVVHKLFEEANAKFGNRQGGYTRIVKLGFRAGDAAPLSMIELVYDEPAKDAKKAAKKPAKKAAAPVAEETAAIETPMEAAGGPIPTEEDVADVAETLAQEEAIAEPEEVIAEAEAEAPAEAEAAEAPAEEAAVEAAPEVLEDGETLAETAEALAEEEAVAETPCEEAAPAETPAAEAAPEEAEKSE